MNQCIQPRITSHLQLKLWSVKAVIRTNLNIKTLDKYQKTNNCLTVRNCYKSTMIGSKSTSIGILTRLVDQSKKQVDYIKTDIDMQVSENYYQSTSRNYKSTTTCISRLVMLISRLILLTVKKQKVDIFSGQDLVNYRLMISRLEILLVDYWKGQVY